MARLYSRIKVNKAALPKGQAQNGSTLSDWEVHAAAGGHAGIAATSDFCDRRGARQAAGGGERAERRAVEYPYRQGGWTVRQVAHHVPDSHMNAYVRFRLALTEQEPTIKPYE